MIDLSSCETAWNSKGLSVRTIFHSEHRTSTSLLTAPDNEKFHTTGV